MGFNSVYRVLQEVFPQVDARMLRAVAIEHSKDSDAAVEIVLVEVIPFLSERSMATCSSGTRADDALLADSTCLDEALNASSSNDANGGDDEMILAEKSDKGSNRVGSDVFSRVTSITLVQDNGSNNDCDKVCVDTESEEIISIGKCQESSAKVGADQNSHATSSTKDHGNLCANGIINDHLHADREDSDGSSGHNFKELIYRVSHQEQSCVDGNPVEEIKSSLVQMDPSPDQECTENAPESSLQLVMPDMLITDFEKPEPNGSLDATSIMDPSPDQECSENAPESSLQLVMPDMLITDFEKPEPNGSFDAASINNRSINEMVDLEDESTLNTMVTRSGQICGIDLLEDIIEDARSNKKTLFSAMESVISLMREVELQEHAAEQVKEEAARGGLGILTRVEDLKKMLQHAKEANDMHAGEVYGEKAILATEVRELQSRLLSLSDERDKSLAILDEMQQTLDLRLAAAEKEMKEAEQEKLEKEASARKALLSQELIMEKVVQESKKLKQEAEENSKLREFLIDRGRVVDMLQGEISVICQDVKLLKEKFDEHVPLGKSFSSRQTSCILASSSSSLKSLAPDQVLEQAYSFETPKKASATSSVDDQLSPGEERARDDHKALVDDGWEFFDNREVYM